MPQLIDIQKVDIGPRTLVARVRVAPGAPLGTDEDPEGTQRVLELLPELAGHLCLGDASESFGEVVEATELAHLLEHVSVELMAESGLAGDISAGRTRALADDPRAFEVEIDCPDDVLAAGALSSAAWVLEWAYSGGGEPVPDIGGIVSGLAGLVDSLTPEPEAEPEPDQPTSELTGDADGMEDEDGVGDGPSTGEPDTFDGDATVLYPMLTQDDVDDPTAPGRGPRDN